MGKKNKRSKKGRKSKGFESPSSKRGRDEVTGLFVEVNSERLYSDTKYDALKSQGGRAFRALTGMSGIDEIEFADGGGGQFVEVELGEKVIAMTLNTFGIRRFGNIDNVSRQSSTRWVLLGDFKYNTDGSLQDGNVLESANWSYFTLWNGGIGEYSSVDRGAPIQEEGIELFGAWREHERVFDYLADYGDNLIEGDPKQNFYNFESSKYFENGWWDNPFDSNLI